MSPDRDIVILTHNIHKLVRRMREDIGLRIAVEKTRHDITHRELHSRDSGGAADGAGGFTQPMANGGLSQFGLTQHRDRMAIKFVAGIGHPELTRRAIEQPDPEIDLKLPNAMAQSRLRNS